MTLPMGFWQVLVQPIPELIFLARMVCQRILVYGVFGSPCAKVTFVATVRRRIGDGLCRESRWRRRYKLTPVMAVAHLRRRQLNKEEGEGDSSLRQ